jgi:hypothetical protein
MAKLLTKGELLQRLGIASNITLTTTLAEMEAAGVEIPSEGEGRSRRFRVGAVKVIKDYRATREPRKRGPKPGFREERASTSAPVASTASVEPLRLAEEDRALLRELLDALRDVAGKLRGSQGAPPEKGLKRAGSRKAFTKVAMDRGRD